MTWFVRPAKESDCKVTDYGSHVEASRLNPLVNSRTSNWVLTKLPDLSHGPFCLKKKKSSPYGAYLLPSFQNVADVRILVVRNEKGLTHLSEELPPVLASSGAELTHLFFHPRPIHHLPSLCHPHTSSSILHPSPMTGNHSSQENCRRPPTRHFKVVTIHTFDQHLPEGGRDPRSRRIRVTSKSKPTFSESVCHRVLLLDRCELIHVQRGILVLIDMKVRRTNHICCPCSNFSTKYVFAPRHQGVIRAKSLPTRSLASLFHLTTTKMSPNVALATACSMSFDRLNIRTSATTQPEPQNNAHPSHWTPQIDDGVWELGHRGFLPGALATCFVNRGPSQSQCEDLDHSTRAHAVATAPLAEDVHRQVITTLLRKSTLLPQLHLGGSHIVSIRFSFARPLIHSTTVSLSLPIANSMPSSIVGASSTMGPDLSFFCWRSLHV